MLSSLYKDNCLGKHNLSAPFRWKREKYCKKLIVYNQGLKRTSKEIIETVCQETLLQTHRTNQKHVFLVRKI